VDYGYDLGGISSNCVDMKFTFRIVSLAGVTLEVGVKTEDDLKQWLDAIRSSCARTSTAAVCLFYMWAMAT